MSKKIISLLITFLIAFGLTPVFAFEDTDGTDYERAVNTLESLGVIQGYEDKTFKPGNTLTRGEFAAMVVRLIDTSVYTISEEQIFSDVNKKHWAFEYVNAGYAIGYFNGYGDGSFAPDEKIAYAEAVKVMVSMLGYGKVAEAQGGYPYGYLKIASQIKLLTGISASENQSMTRGNVALLIYNCLDKPMLVQSSFGSDKVEFTEDSTRTILTEGLGCDRFEGTLTATKVTGIFGYAALDEDKVLVGDTEFNVGKSDIAAYLGYKLVVYVEEDEKTEEKTVLFYEIAEENNAVTVVADDIDSSTNLRIFSYWDSEDKLKSVALDYNVQVIINSKYQLYFDLDDIAPTSGTVTLLDNDGDSGIDVVAVKKYSHYVVEKLDSTDLVIYDKYGKAPIFLEPDGKDVTYSIIRNGSNAKFKNISVGAVLSVLQSDDGEYIEVHIVISPVRGKVTEVVDGDSYTIGELGTFKRSSDLPDSEIIEIGFDGTFYLDIEGRIIKVEAGNAADGNYCYLLTAGRTEGLGGSLHMKIVNAKGEIETLKVSDKVSFDGAKKSENEIIDALGGEGTTVRQPLRYAQNEAGEITRIEIPSLDYDTASRYYRRGTRMFGYRGSGGSFFINEEMTVMFQVPSGGTGAEESYKVIEYDDLANYNQAYSVTGYDLDGLTVQCAVVDVPESVTSAEITGNCCVLMNVTNAVDADGDPAVKLYYMQNGKKQEGILSDKVVMKHYNLSLDDEVAGYSVDITANDLKPGDVFHITLDGNDNINSVARVLSIGGTDLSTVPQFNVSRGFSAEKTFGRAEKLVNYGLLVNAFNASTGLDSDLLYDLTKPGGGIYMYDSRNKTVTAASASDIMDVEDAGDNAAYVYVRCNAGNVGDVIIFYPNR